MTFGTLSKVPHFGALVGLLILTICSSGKYAKASGSGPCRQDASCTQYSSGGGAEGWCDENDFDTCGCTTNGNGWQSQGACFS
jgi:hypothetical protein